MGAGISILECFCRIEKSHELYNGRIFYDSYIHVNNQNTFVATDTEFGRNFSRTLTTSDLFDCAAR